MPGLFLGWVQQLRGAHFLTHTLWSAWVASLVIVCIARLLHRSLRNNLTSARAPRPPDKPVSQVSAAPGSKWPGM